jgi:hypothetical protein
MRRITTTTGAQLLLDGDLLVIMETLYREVALRLELKHSFEDISREIQHLVEQMSDDERRQYLVESLFLNSVTYENEKLKRFVEKLPKDA